MTRLERHDDPTAALFVPLACGFLDDIEVNDCSPLAQLVYIRALLHTKRAATDGLLSLRQVTGGLFSHVSPAVVQEAAVELCERGLWSTTDHDDRYVISSWLKHNESSLQRSAERSAKRSGAHKTNHGKGLHDDHPVDDCPLCLDGPDRPPPDDSGGVSPDGSAHCAKRPLQRPLDGSAERAQETETETETETEKEKPSSSSTVNQRPPATSIEDDDDPKKLAETALTAAGYRNVEPTAGETQAITTALKQGWPPDHILDRARRAGLADDPRAYLGQCLTELVNTAPDITPPADELDLSFADLTGLPEDPDAELAARLEATT